VVSGTPQEDGQFPVTITAEDSVGDSTSSNTFNVTVSPPPNQSPEFNTTIASQTIIIGTAIQAITVDFTDPDGDALSYSATGLPAGVAINAATGTITGSPGAVGTSSVTVTATDTDGASASSNTFTITVEAIPNNDPVFNGPVPTQTGIVGSALSTLQLSGFFADIDSGDTLGYAISSGTLPAGVTLSASGALAGTPTAVGNSTVVVTATDQSGASASSNPFVIVVTAANVAPEIVSRSPTGVISIEIGSDETVSLTVTDESPSSLTYSVTSSDEDVVDVTAVDDEEFEIQTVSVGSATITVVVTDSEGLSDSEIIDVVVDALPNDPPVINSRLPSGASLTIDSGTNTGVSIDVTDEDVTTLVYSASSDDTGVATVSVGSAGNFSISGLSPGAATITLLVEDEVGQTDSESFDVVVPAINQPPEITARTPAADPLTGILIGDTDPVTLTVVDEDTSTLAFTATSSDVTIVTVDAIDQDGIVFLQGQAEGLATITITVTDDGALTDSISFDVAVPGPVNGPPTVTGSLPDVAFEEALAIATLDVSGIFDDPDGDTLTYGADQLPDGLSIDPTTGEIDGIPTTVETVTVTVAVTDAGGTATVVTAAPFDIEITAAPVVNLPPTVGSAIPDQSVEENTVLGIGDLNIAGVFSDPESDTLEFSVDQLPDGLVLDADTGDITGTPTTVETVVVTVSAVDAGGSNTVVDAAPFDFEITAEPVANLPPTVGSAIPDQSIEEDTLVAVGDLNIAGFFSDPESDTLEFSVDQLPDGLVLDTDTGDITGTPTTVETVVVTVSAVDAGGSNTVVSALPFDFEITAAAIANLPPTVGAVIPDQSIEEGTPVAIGDLNIASVFSDPESDTLEYSVDQLPDGLVLDVDTGDIAGTPTTVETVAVTVSAVDAGGSNTVVDAAPFDFEITAAAIANLPPTVDAVIGDQSFEENIALVPGDLNVASIFSDPESDVLEYSVDQLPTDLVIDADTGDILGTPSVVETVTATVSAIDPAGSNTPVSALPFAFEIAAAPVVASANQPPVFSGPIPDLSLDIDVAIVPQDLSVYFTDPENDVLSYSFDQLPAGLALGATTGILSGTPTALEKLDVIISAEDLAGSATIVTADTFEIEVE